MESKDQQDQQEETIMSSAEQRKKLIKAIDSAYSDCYNSIQGKDWNGIYKIRTLIVADHKGHYVCVHNEEADKVSFSKEPGSKIKIKTTLRRYIRRHLEITEDLLSDAGLDRFGCLTLRTTCPSEFLKKGLRFLSGKDIIEFYSTAKISSCMAAGGSNLTRMYALNPDKVQLLVIDKVMRALFWTTDDGTKVMDRVYPGGCDNVELLREWAKENNVIYRYNISSNDSYERTRMINDKFYYVTLKHQNIFPYMDTFAWARRNADGTVTLCNDMSKIETDIILRSQSGGYYTCYKCTNCKCGVLHDDSLFRFYDQRLCKKCFYAVAILCQSCARGYKEEDIMHFSKNGYNFQYCKSCYQDRVKPCQQCKDSLHIHTEKYIIINNEYYHKACAEANFDKCESCTKYTRKSENALIKTLVNSQHTHFKMCKYCIDKYFTNYPTNITKCYNCSNIFHRTNIKQLYCFHCIENTYQ